MKPVAQRQNMSKCFFAHNPLKIKKVLTGSGAIFSFRVVVHLGSVLTRSTFFAKCKVITKQKGGLKVENCITLTFGTSLREKNEKQNFVSFFLQG